MNALFHLFNEFSVDRNNRLILAIDCKKYNNWRMKYYEENSKDFLEYNEPIRQKYKGNRKKDEEIPWDKIYEILEDFLTVLKDYSDVQVIQHPRAEADDIIATVVNIYSSTEEIIIVSSDSDFKQLLSKNVSLFNPISRKMLKIN